MICEQDPVSRFVRSIEHPSLNRRPAPVKLPSPPPQVCDGFVLSGPVMPDGMYRVLRMVVPELQRRGVFRKHFEEGKTFRESIGLERPKNRFFDA
jgi:hypothetical protein